MSGFKKATKAQSKLRLALTGPSGSGKTFSSLSIGSHLGSKVAVVDTEHGSASKYADLFSFDVLELESFHPEKYIQAIKDAEVAGYDVVIIDSLSHAWIGKDGALELVDNAAKRSNSKNTFTAWRDVTPLQNALVDSIIQSKLHIIATMRSKTEYVMEAGHNGKVTPKKVGLAPVQRDNMEYEFDVVGEMDVDNNLIVTKTRCVALNGKVFAKPGKEIADILSGWLSSGEAAKVAPEANAANLRVEKAGDTYLVHGDGASFEVYKADGATQCTCEEYRGEFNVDPKYICPHKRAVIEHAKLNKELNSKAAAESVR